MDKFLECGVQCGYRRKKIQSAVSCGTRMQGLKTCGGSKRYSISFCGGLVPYWDVQE